MSSSQSIFSRLSANYTSMYIYLGIMTPFWGMWLRSKGLSASEIGILIAIPYILKIFVAPTVPPLTIAAARISIGALVIASYVLLKGEKLPSHKSIWIKGSIIGIIGVGVPFTFISWAMLYINSGTGAICMSVIPLCVFVMAHFVHADERMSWTGFVGILSGICGVIVLFYDSLSISDEGSFGAYALIAMMLASFGYALSNILIKKYVKTDPINTSFVMLTTSSLLLWPLAFIFEQPLSINYGSTEILSLLYLGVLPTGITTMILVIFTQVAGSTFVSYNTYLIPIVGVMAGYVFLDEALRQTTILSIIFIAIGIYISQRPKRKRNLT